MRSVYRMESGKRLFPLFSLFIFSLLSGEGSAGHHHHHHHHNRHHHHHHHHREFQPTKLFVFGDSYVDTGNVDISISSAHNFPYGISFPGKPTGRFSDGRILTDFTARYYGLKSPIPFRVWKRVEKTKLKNGVNFAYGGTGVFDTSFPFPNMTTQIDFLQNLISDSVFTRNDIHSSVVLVSVSGNDYSFKLTTNSSTQGFIPFIISVVNQIRVNLKRIHSLGVKKVVVTGLGPLGCIPEITASSSFTQCNQTLNLLVDFHNLLLKNAVANLNRETKDSPFFVLDFFDTFQSILHNKGSFQGKTRFKTPLKPCCYGVSSEYSCGSVDEKGKKMYKLCKDPKSAFFWDSVHPTQQGWIAAFTSFKSTLK